MDPLALRLCELIKDEIIIIEKLKDLSFNFKDVVVKRDLNALDENNNAKKATLMNMVSLQRTKDAHISEMSVELGLDKDSSVRDILDSKKLDDNSSKLLDEKYYLLEEEIKALDRINNLISIMLLSSFKLNNNLIHIFRVHGTVDSTYTKNVKVKASKRHSQINRKI